MAILPTQLARVSNNLSSSLARRTLTQTQQALLEVQNQLSTGKKLNAPSDDPGAAAIAMQLKRALAQRQAYSSNIQFASSQLGEVDSTLSDLSDLLRQAESVASANVGTDVSADARSAAAAVVDSLYQQAITLGNRQFQGMYLFSGDSGATAPFTSNLGGVQFNGSDRVLKNSYDQSTVLPFMVNGSAVFGAMSTGVQGADLSPNMGLQTRLADLGGAGGAGIRKGSIQISDGTSTAIVDLSQADTVGDVINAIKGAGVGTIDAALGADGKSIQLIAGAADNITVTDLSGGTTAADLGILRTTGGGTKVNLDGSSVQPKLTALTRLADLRDGAGIDLAHGMVITNDATSATIDLSSLDPAKATVQDLLSAVNNAGVGALARINAGGNGIEVLNTVQGSTMTIGENGGTTAADLGVVEAGGVEASGIFANLAKLRDALDASDTSAITAAAGAIQADLDRVVLVRGQVGAQVQALQNRQQRLDDQNLATQSLLSSIQDTDYTDAITRFQTLQTALQANLQTTGRVLSLSLLDFLS